MPPTLTYPGIYIEEIPSGVRTITGVATSITAFVGWAPMGPTRTAAHIFSFSDFERTCGGLHPESDLGIAVKHFFENGGSEAHIVRLVHTEAKVGEATVGGIKVKASSPGDWSLFYGVVVTPNQSNSSRFRLAVVQFPPNASGSPNTTVTNPPVVESFENLSVNANDLRYVKSVVNDLKRGSRYIEVDDPVPAQPPTAEAREQLTGGLPGPVLKPLEAVFQEELAKVAAEDGLMDKIDLFNLVCVPGLTPEDDAGANALKSLQAFCRIRRAFLIIDAPKDATVDNVKNFLTSVTGNDAANAAFYFPWVKAPNPLSENRPKDYPPCGIIAGIYARTDSTRGVWKAPAGIDASLTGATGPKDVLTDKQNGSLNPKAVNCLRSFPVYGTVVWGARTVQGDDERGSEWKYIPVRRTALYIEESLYRALKWVVFEPNDEPLWAQIRLNVGAFMQDLFRKGAFQGRSPREAYFVKCDKETTTQSDINRGVVNILVGFAPLKPAEFVVIKIQQIAGDIQT